MEDKENLPAKTETAGMLAVIERVALDPSVDVAKLEKMLDMQERILAKQSEVAFNHAVEAVSKELPRIKKGGTVDYKDKNTGKMEKAFDFARIEDIDKVLRPLLPKHGLSLSFTSEPRVGDGGGLTMIGTLSHVDGHSRTASIALPLDSSGGKNNLQAMGSSLSYGRRYTTCMLLNIVVEGEDDDGNAVSEITTEQAVEIDKKLNDLEADKPAFLKIFEVKDVRNINAKDYKKAMALLAKKEKAHAAGK